MRQHAMCSGCETDYLYSPPSRHLQLFFTSTIMQLIASNMLLIQSETSETQKLCALPLNVIDTNGILVHEDNNYW